MAFIHKILKGGGEEFLPFALAQERKLRATGLTYASQNFAVDGATIKVRLEGDQSFIEIEGSGGGYVVIEVTNSAGEEHTVVHDIRQKAPDKPPYSTKKNPYQHYDPSFWVGGSPDKPMVSHVDRQQSEYVTNASSPQKWTGGGRLRMMFFNGASSKWIYVILGTPSGATGFTLMATDSKTGLLATVSVIDLGADSLLAQDDDAFIDASPDGSKFMFVWRKTDPLLGFTLSKKIREYNVSKWTDQETKLPLVGTSPTDTALVTGVLSDTRDDNYFRGTVTTKTLIGIGYGWDGIRKDAYTMMVETWAQPPSDPPVDGPGSYSGAAGATTYTKTVEVNGSKVLTATGAGNTAWTATVIEHPEYLDGAVSNSTRTTTIVAADFKVVFYDPRSGAYGVITKSVTKLQSIEARVVSTPLYVEKNTGQYSATQLVLHIGGKEKSWEIYPGAQITGPNTTSTPSNGYSFFGTQFSAYPSVDMSPALYFQHSFASRTKGECVFAFAAPSKKIIAFAGSKAGLTDFISDDASGLKKFGATGFQLSKIYPI